MNSLTISTLPSVLRMSILPPSLLPPPPQAKKHPQQIDKTKGIIAEGKTSSSHHHHSQRICFYGHRRNVRQWCPRGWQGFSRIKVGIWSKLNVFSQRLFKPISKFPYVGQTQPSKNDSA